MPSIQHTTRGRTSRTVDATRLHRAGAPVPGASSPLVEELMREMAFVLRATQSVKKAILEGQALSARR